MSQCKSPTCECNTGGAADPYARSDQRDDGLVHVERGVRWSTAQGSPDGQRDFSVAYYAPSGHPDLAAIVIGATAATCRLGEGGGPVLTPEQARRVGVALLQAAERAEAKSRG